MRDWIFMDHASGLSGKPLMRSIVEATAVDHGVASGDIMARDRTTEVAMARQDAYHRIQATGRFSYPAIGRFFGRDHTTVLHGVRRHRDRIAEARP